MLWSGCLSVYKKLWFNNIVYVLIIIPFIGCRYHEATENANARVLELLRELSAKLQTKINVLVFASMLLVIAKALFSHAWYVMCFNLFPLKRFIYVVLM